MKYNAIDQNNQIERFELSKDEKIGEGATAIVYKVNYKNQTWAAKIFKAEQKINSSKLKAMLEHQPDDLSVNIDGEEFIQYTWVKYVIKNGVGKVIGFMMPYVDHDDTYSLDTFYDPVLSKRLKPKDLALTLRIQLAINLCELIDNLHKNKNYFVDIKPQNIKVYKKNHKVVLLDCDGYSINNSNGSPNRFDAELISTDYIAPEVTREKLMPGTLGLQQDLYGLAVILFQLLNRGTHPFQGITTDKNISASTNDERASLGLYAYGLNENWKVKPRSQSIHNLFLDETRALFDKSFKTESRTSAEEWINHFKEILNNTKLVFCDKVDGSKKLDKDLIHIKFKGKGCIGCKLESEIKTLKPIRKKENKLNTNSNSTTSASIKSASFKTSGYISNKNKPDDFDFTEFFIWAAVVIAAIFLIFLLGNSSNNSLSSTSNIQVSPTSIQKNESCSIDFKYFTPKQLCETYWSKTVTHHHTCNIAISKELGDRGFYSFPEEKCGRKTIDSSLPADAGTGNKPKNPQSGSSENFSDKVNKLATEYGSNTLSFNLVRNNPDNNIVYKQIIKDIVNKFEESDKNTELKDGLIVHKKINLPYISKVVWYASDSDTCNNNSLGTKEICLLSNGAAICQPIELNINYKSLCVESFTR
jgi:serine/threonine protein kinase